MKTRYILYTFVIVFFMAGFMSSVFAQSNNCTVMENNGGLLTVSCPGEGPKMINMGGTADKYKKGDPITVNGQRNNSRDEKARGR
jgi:hypothetical protein